jgi:hypothetical protein
MGLKFARREDLYKLDWQAGLIYTLAGSNQTNAKDNTLARLFKASFANNEVALAA